MTNEVINLTTYYYKKSEIDTLLDEKADIDSIPTKTSDLVNDDNFISSNKGTFTELKNLIDNANDGDTIVLEKDYLYNPDIDVSITITANKSLIIKGNNHIIDCNGKGWNFYVSTGIDVYDTIFQNFISPVVSVNSDVSDVNIINSVFSNNNTSMEILFNGGTGKNNIINCTFTNNINSSSCILNAQTNGVTVKDCTFNNNTNTNSNNKGACITSPTKDYHSINVYDNTFIIDDGWDNPLLNCVNYIGNESEVKKDIGDLTELVTLINNASNGDTIILEKNYIYQTNISSPGINFGKELHINGNGHKIDINNHGLSFTLYKGSSVRNLTVTNSRSLQFETAENTIIENCKFTKFKSSGERGHIIDVNNKNAYINNCIFEDNDYFPIQCNGYSNINITNCIFNNNPLLLGSNQSQYQNGVIQIMRAAQVNIENCEFSENTTRYGAIYNESNSNVNIIDNIFNNNTASDTTINGGAISTIYISDNLFVCNNELVSSTDTLYQCINQTINVYKDKIDTAGLGLYKNGTILNHTNNVTAQASTVFKKISYDNTGHITGTTNVTASDIPALTKSKISDFTHIHNTGEISDTSAYANIGSSANATQKTINGKINTVLGEKANTNNVYGKSETYTQSEITTLISNAVGDLQLFEVVNSLPTSNIKTNRLYLIVNDETITNNEYDIYLRVNDDWEQLDSLEFDISNFYNKTEIDTLLSGKVDTSDSRLTNARTPTSHSHGDITNTGTIGTDANKPLITTANGKIATGSFGTTANTFVEGNDSRLSDARQPLTHTHNKSEITDLTIPTKVSELTNDSGYLTSHQDISGKENISNKVTTISASSTNDEYPTALTVYNALQDVGGGGLSEEDLLGAEQIISNYNNDYKSLICIQLINNDESNADLISVLNIRVNEDDGYYTYIPNKEDFYGGPIILWNNDRCYIGIPNDLSSQYYNIYLTTDSTDYYPSSDYNPETNERYLIVSMNFEENKYLFKTAPNDEEVIKDITSNMIIVRYDATTTFDNRQDDVAK